MKSPFLIAAVVIGFYFVSEPYTNRWVMEQETTASGYAILAKEFPTLSPATQQAIRERLSKGYLTRYDVSDSISEIVKERPGGVQVSLAPDFGDEPVGTTTTLWRSVMGERGNYKSKSILVAQMSNGIRT